MSRQDKGRRSPERPKSYSLTQEDMNMNAGLNMVKTGLLQVNSQDLRVWELITMVPQVGNIWAYVCCAMNVFIPGSGTMLCACLGDSNMNKT